MGWYPILQLFSAPTWDIFLSNIPRDIFKHCIYYSAQWLFIVNRGLKKKKIEKNNYVLFGPKVLMMQFLCHALLSLGAKAVPFLWGLCQSTQPFVIMPFLTLTISPQRARSCNHIIESWLPYHSGSYSYIYPFPDCGV